MSENIFSLTWYFIFYAIALIKKNYVCTRYFVLFLFVNAILNLQEFELAKTEKMVDVNKIKQEIESLSKEKSKLDANISDLRLVCWMVTDL